MISLRDSERHNALSCRSYTALIQDTEQTWRQKVKMSGAYYRQSSEVLVFVAG